MLLAISAPIAIVLYNTECIEIKLLFPAARVTSRLLLADGLLLLALIMTKEQASFF